MSSSSVAPLLLALALTFAALPDPAEGGQRVINIDGGWSPWSSISTPCLRRNAAGSMVPVTCGGGKQTRVRSCTNPRPQGLVPKPCEGPSEMDVTCNDQPCDMQWSAWSECSADCGRGNRNRFTMCAESKGGNLTNCKDLGLTAQAFEHIEECNTWDKKTCQNPCNTDPPYKCMEFANCVDISTDEDPQVECVCQLGRIKDDSGEKCIIPPPTTPTPRPIPTLAPAVKTATTAVTKTASTLLVIFVGVTIFLFAALRIYDDGRVIQLNMEISLIMAHICLLLPALYDYPWPCRVVSILIHFFFTAAFMFMFLESLHVYAQVAYVVKKNGLLSKWQNILVGYGIPFGVILVSLAMNLYHYGGKYHCWLQMDIQGLVMAWLIPIVIVVILTFTVIEASSASEYRTLPGMNKEQLLSARIMQKSNLIIMPLTFASIIVGMSSEYQQDVALYSIFTVLNGVLGGCVFFFHCTGNEKVRQKLQRMVQLCMRRAT